MLPASPAEEGKWTTAFQAALILVGAFSLSAFSGVLQWQPPPSPPPLRVSLIPDIPTEPVPPLKEVEKEPEKVVATPPKKTEDAAEIVREREQRKQREERERKRKEEEQKRKEEEEKQRKKKEEEERRKKEEEEAKRLAEQKRKEEEEKAAQAAKAAEDAARQEIINRRLSRLEADIIRRTYARINTYLKTPQSVPKSSDVEVLLLIRLTTDGDLAAPPEILESSGYSEYDESAIRAVILAAPLPVPVESFVLKDAKLMQRFLEHRFRISPVR